MGIEAALIGSSVLGAGANIYAGNRAAQAQRSAAGQAADSQLQAAREANQLQWQMFNQSRMDSAPWRAAGTQALGVMQGFMGLPQTPAAPTPVSGGFSGVNTGGSGGAMQGGGFAPQPAPNAPQMDPRAQADLSTGQPVSTLGPSNVPNGPLAQQIMARNGGMLPQGTPQAPQQAVPMAEPPSAQSAFDTFRNSINYDFTRQQGENALTRLLARNGQLNSGRGMTAALDFGQNLAHERAVMPFLNQLNLQAGIGQNAAMMSGQQGMQAAGNMGANLMNAGAGQANALMAAGNARAGAYQNMGNALSNLLNQGAGIYGMRRAGMFGPGGI